MNLIRIFLTHNLEFSVEVEVVLLAFLVFFSPYEQKIFLQMPKIIKKKLEAANNFFIFTGNIELFSNFLGH